MIKIHHKEILKAIAATFALTLIAILPMQANADGPKRGNHGPSFGGNNGPGPNFGNQGPQGGPHGGGGGSDFGKGPMLGKNGPDLGKGGHDFGKGGHDFGKGPNFGKGPDFGSGYGHGGKGGDFGKGGRDFGKGGKWFGEGYGRGHDYGKGHGKHHKCDRPTPPFVPPVSVHPIRGFFGAQGQYNPPGGVCLYNENDPQSAFKNDCLIVRIVPKHQTVYKN